MAVNGEVAFDFGDGRHTFNVARFEQAFELEQKCDAGLFEILQRINAGRWRVTDLVEVHRLGLVGGGMKPGDALRLVRRYVEGRPWAESTQGARLILMAALVGVPGDNDAGKAPADRAATEAANPAVSSDPPSTDSARP